MEQLDYNLLYRWFVGLGIDEQVWHPTAFTTNRDRLFEGDVAAKFLEAVLSHPRVRQLLSREHFTVDGTLVDAWASEEFRPKDDRDEPPAAATPAGTSTASVAATTRTPRPPTRRPAVPQGPRQRGQAVLHGPRADGEPPWSGGRGRADPAAGFAERLAAVALVAGCAGPRPITVGADKGYDTGDFVMELRELGAAPHVAQHTAGRHSAIDRRTTRHPGYQHSQRARHRIEEVFAWVKTIAGQSKTKHRGLDRVRWHFTLASAAYNLIRLPKLLGAPS